MKRYHGDRTIDGIVATVDGAPLDPRFDLRIVDEGGFEWSFDGPAAQQLALAILADHLGDDTAALRLYPAFAREIIANFANEWELTGADVDAAVQALQ